MEFNTQGLFIKLAPRLLKYGKTNMVKISDKYRKLFLKD